MTSFSFWAVAIEGPIGGKLDKYNYNGISANFLILYVTMPLFILFPLIAKEFDSKLVGTLMTGALIGGITQDFVWFVVNPAFGILKFNSSTATWLSWFNFGAFELPDFYVYDLVLAFLSWFVFIKNSQRVEKIYKKFKKYLRFVGSTH